MPSAFSLQSIPSDARVLRAELRIYQAAVTGDPYGKLGNVVVDHVDYIGRAGIDSYDGQNLCPDVGVISTNAVLETKTLDVTNQVQEDLAFGATWSQFRLRFWRPSILLLPDHENDCVYFSDAETSWPRAYGEPPMLYVEYER